MKSIINTFCELIDSFILFYELFYNFTTLDFPPHAQTHHTSHSSSDPFLVSTVCLMSSCHHHSKTLSINLDIPSIFPIPCPYTKGKSVADLLHHTEWSFVEDEELSCGKVVFGFGCVFELFGPPECIVLMSRRPSWMES